VDKKCQAGHRLTGRAEQFEFDLADHTPKRTTEEPVKLFQESID